MTVDHPSDHPVDHATLLQQETAAFADLLAAADLAAPVPSCPGWSVAELGRHTGSVHLWAREAMRSDSAPAEPPGPDDDAEVPGFYAAAAGTLLHAVRTTPAGQPCWTFDRTDRTAGFWLRRQVHETALHRWDAGHALGHDPQLDAAVTADGIDEVLGMFLPRQVRLGRIAVTPDVVHLLPDGGGAVLPVGTGDLGAVPVGTVSGPAEALLLLLWRRIPPTDHRLEVQGDRAAVVAALDRPLTP